MNFHVKCLSVRLHSLDLATDTELLVVAVFAEDILLSNSHGGGVQEDGAGLASEASLVIILASSRPLLSLIHLLATARAAILHLGTLDDHRLTHTRPDGGIVALVGKSTHTVVLLVTLLAEQLASILTGISAGQKPVAQSIAHHIWHKNV